METILNLPIENKIFYAVLVFSWTVYLWEAYLAYRQVIVELYFVS
jgi:STE24 endopeptidase